jgi:hypothetical protein
MHQGRQLLVAVNLLGGAEGQAEVFRPAHPVHLHPVAPGPGQGLLQVVQGLPILLLLRQDGREIVQDQGLLGSCFRSFAKMDLAWSSLPASRRS